MTTGQIAIIVLILLGAGFMLISAIGIVRLPDVFSRMHTPARHRRSASVACCWAPASFFWMNSSFTA